MGAGMSSRAMSGMRSGAQGAAGGKCVRCATKVGPRSTVYCEYHAGYHAGHAKGMMAGKRKYNPAYREAERIAVTQRMRKLRADPNYQRPDMVAK